MRTARPSSGAAIEIAGLGDEARTTSNASGAYSFKVLAPTGEGHTLSVAAGAQGRVPGGRQAERDRTDGGTTPVNFVLERDWSSPAGGAGVERSTGPDNTSQGCGPGGLIDDDPATVWGSANIAPEIVVDLGAPVQVSRMPSTLPRAAATTPPRRSAASELRRRDRSGGPVHRDRPARVRSAPPTTGALNDAFTGAAPRPLPRARALSPQGGPGERRQVRRRRRAAGRASSPSPLGPTADTGGGEGVGAPARRSRHRDAARGRPPSSSSTARRRRTARRAPQGRSGRRGSDASRPRVRAPAVDDLSLPRGRRGARGAAIRGGDRTFVTAPAPPTPTPTPTPTPRPALTTPVPRFQDIEAPRQPQGHLQGQLGSAPPRRPASAQLRVCRAGSASPSREPRRSGPAAHVDQDAAAELGGAPADQAREVAPGDAGAAPPRRPEAEEDGQAHPQAALTWATGPSGP